MKIIKNTFLGVMLIVCACFLAACGQIQLSPLQQQAYNEVVTYAKTCSNTEEILNEIKKDISKVDKEEKLNIEVKIGKLKIDIIKTEEEANKDIETKESEARYNKSSYKSKRDSITNKYYGTESQYLSEKARLNNYISTAYA